MIDSIPVHERPRERCLKVGAHCLSLRECIAVILGSGPKKVGCLGIAQKILQPHVVPYSSEDESRAFFLAMETSPHAYLSEISGLGEASVARILAAFELGRKYFLFKSRKGVSASTFQSPLALQALKKIPESFRHEVQEWLGFIPIYSGGKVGKLCVVDRGARTHVNTDPAEFFSKLLALKPHDFFLAHNHPSGSIHASTQDLDLTRRIAHLSSQLGIHCRGHWIVTSGNETFIPVDSEKEAG